MKDLVSKIGFFHSRQVFFSILLGAGLMIGCQSDPWDINPSADNQPLEVGRFDRAFFQEADSFPVHFHELEEKYPVFFEENRPMSFWKEIHRDQAMRNLFEACQDVFPNLDSIQDELGNLYAFAQHYYPETKRPKAYAYVSGIDPEFPVILADSLLFIGLDNYLGKDYEGYGFLHLYLRPERSKPYLVRDVAEKIALEKLGPCMNCETLLDAMLYKGKQLLALDAFLPNTPDSVKIKFSGQELDWCEENDFGMWRYLVENDLLYDRSFKTKQRFLEPAPFTKFYTSEDKESPGRAGAWIGWQILKAYHQETGKPLQEILKAESSEILAQSNYKPRR